MSLSRWTSAALTVAAAALSAATCQEQRAPERDKPTNSSPLATTSTPAQSQSKAAPAADPPPAEPKWDKLSPAARREFENVLSDEFCFCGCPHSLGACLRTHRTCKHAPRMAELAASEAESGAPSVEISVALSKYYLSFRERRSDLRTDASLCQGPKGAKVTLVEFSDFECPHCGAARPILEQFAKNRSSEVRFCFAPFPLPTHVHAQIAGQAALFARDRGKFWAMHDLLFENQTRLSKDSILELATRIGLNASQLGQALDSGQYLDELKASKKSGEAAGVESTPTLYINGRKLTLNLTETNLKVAVEDEMEWAANHNGWAKD